VEFAAGGIKGGLRFFPAVVNQRAAILMDHIADKLFRGDLSQGRVFVEVSYDLAAEQPHIIDVVLDGSLRQAGPGEVEEKRHEAFDKSSAGWEVFFFAHPTLWPLLKIAAVR
jgi:hypothetical protein